MVIRYSMGFHRIHLFVMLIRLTNGHRARISDENMHSYMFGTGVWYIPIHGAICSGLSLGIYGVLRALPCGFSAIWTDILCYLTGGFISREIDGGNDICI